MTPVPTTNKVTQGVVELFKQKLFPSKSPTPAIDITPEKIIHKVSQNMA